MIPTYLAAPLTPIEGETREGNIARAQELYRRACLAHPDRFFLTQWVLNAACFEETEEHREIGMKRNIATLGLIALWPSLQESRKYLAVPRGAIWLAGPRISSGMRAEAAFAERVGLEVESFIGPEHTIHFER
jgi:hypothetical protein